MLLQIEPLSIVNYIIIILLFTTANSIDSSYFNCRNQSCNALKLNCIDNRDCFIDCAFFTNDDDESCQDAVINCPANATCTLNCDGRESCDNARINAQQSTKLNISCNNHYEACLESEIKCPLTTNPTSPTCFIYGNNSNPYS